jgi:hypothetical protein
MIQNINLDKAQVSAELHGYMYDAIYGKSGIYDYGSCLDYELVSNNEIKIKDGLLLNHGRFMRIVGTESLTIQNGLSDTTRYDLLVAHFETDGINETHDLRIIKGDNDQGIPAFKQEDIYNGGYVYELPLYTIYLNGLNVETITKLFDAIYSIDDLKNNLSNPNLLANGNFQVNTKGTTTYPNTNQWAYSLDKWKYIGLMTVTKNSDGTITIAKTSNSNATYFAQDLDKVYSGDITLSFKVTQITGTLSVYMESTNTDMLEVTEAGTYDIYSANGCKNVIFRLDGTTTSVTLEWVKIEQSIFATKFNPIPLNEEMILCGIAVSDGSDYGEVGTWDDGNPSNEDRLYRFVTIVGDNREIGIANSTSQIVGTSNKMENVGFLGNYTQGAESDTSKVVVSILGVAFVKTNDNTIVANDRVMSDDNGYAVKSTNDLGYRVLSVFEDGLLEIVVSPNTDMIQRIKETHIPKKITLGTTWTQDSTNGYYTQTVSVSWIKEKDYPDIYLNKSGTYSNMKTQIKEFAKIVDAEASNGSIKFIASSATTTSLTLLVKVG